MKRELLKIQSLRLKWRAIINLPDESRKISVGVALGLALDFLPLPFVSIPVAYLLARALRVNVVATVLSLIFFKAVLPLIYLANFATAGLLWSLCSPNTSIPEQPVPRDNVWLMLGKYGICYILGSILNAVLAFGVAGLVVKRILLGRNR